MKVKISVTQDDIDNGDQMRCDSCPIALAASRIWPAREVYVEAQDMTIDRSRHLSLPLSATDFVLDFDNGSAVEPFEFEIEVPDELAPAGAS